MRWLKLTAARAGVAAALVLSLSGVMAGCATPVPGAAAAAPERVAPQGAFRPGQLSAVAATSARSAWAVGVTSGNRPLIEHSDGRTWSVVRGPGLGTAHGFIPLQGVSVLSGGNVWAAGEVALGGHTLIVRWDGTAWQRVPSPSPSAGGSGLTGVAATSAANAWAVGSAASSSILSTTLIEHWDGQRWKHVPSPAPQPGCGGCEFPGDSLAGVAATSASNAWAVGETGRGALIEHWDGARWRWVHGPSAALPGGSLSSVAATSATDAWAVGTADGGDKTLIEHWNGTTWTRVPSPSPGPAASGNALTGVAATSATNAWAVGSSGDKTLIEHWNGSTWTPVPAPSPGDQPQFLGVAATSATSAWAVGLSSDHTLIVHWNGSTWSRQTDG